MSIFYIGIKRIKKFTTTHSRASSGEKLLNSINPASRFVDDYSVNYEKVRIKRLLFRLKHLVSLPPESVYIHMYHAGSCGRANVYVRKRLPA